MKDTLVPGLAKTTRIDVDASRTVAFLGDDSRVYSTPFLLHDIETTSRLLIREHLDENEDTVGTHADISHLAPTPLGLWVDIRVTITGINGRRIETEFECRDALDTIAKGTHSRFVVDRLKTVDQIKSKQQKAAG